MGKKKDKKSQKRDYFGARYKTGDVGNLMDRYGIEGTNSVKPSTRNSYNEERTYEDVEKDIADAMMNDYDTRRGMEAAAMAGNKDAKKFAKKGFTTKNMYEAYDLMKDLKKEYVGGGGMRGAKNEAGLTHALVKADRTNFTEDIKGMIPEQEADSSTADNVDEKKEAVLSEHMQKAKNLVDQWESGNQPGYNPEAREYQKNGYVSPFAKDAKKTFAIDEKIDVNKINKSEEEQAQSFLDKQKEKVKSEKNFKPIYG